MTTETETRTRNDEPQQPHAPQRTPAAPVEPVRRRIPLADIIVDSEVQARVELSEAAIADYREAMLAGDQFPGVVVFEGADGIVLSDGFTRVAAAGRAGLTDIMCDVRPGTKDDAILHACGANAVHTAQRRTNADKPKAAARLLRNPEWGRWSDVRIAEQCIVSHSFVSALRKELAPSPSTVESERKVKTKHGGTTTMKTGKIGKRKKKLTTASPASPPPQQSQQSAQVEEPQPQQEPPQAAPVAEKDEDAAQRDPEAPVAAAPLTISMFPAAAAIQIIELLGDRPASWKAAVARQMLVMLGEPAPAPDKPEPPAPNGGGADNNKERAAAPADPAPTAPTQPEPGFPDLPGNLDRRVESESTGTAPPTEAEPAELPPERRLDDDEFSVLWTLEDGNITVERATKGKRLYSHDLDAPTVLARLKRRKLIQVRKGKMLLTKLGRELMTEADQEPKRHCEQMKFAANTALKAGKHVWKYDGAWYAILKPQEGDDPTDYPYIYDNDDKFGPYATAAEAEAAWAEDNAKAEEPGSS